MFDLQAAQAALERHEKAIDAALGAEAPAFWGQVATAMQDIEAAGNPQAKAEATGRLERICQQHSDVWELIVPTRKPEEERKEKTPMTPTPVPAKPTAAEKPSFDSWLTALREGVTGCLGVLIVLTTLVLILSTFLLLLLRPAAEFEPMRNILVMLNGMTGVVLGYYFGRMPTEARAQQAEKGRDSAEAQRTEAEKKAADEATRSAVLQAGLRGLQADLGALPAPGTRGAKAVTPAQLDATRARIQRLLDEAQR